MAKDPAFLFYTNDFLSGISDLTMEERGQYITLLCLQHQKGRLTEKMIMISCGNATADVIQKFKKDKEGLFYNERLEKEIKKRSEHAEKQRQRALKGWEKRKKENKNNNLKNKDATAYATALPLEDVNENENIDLTITHNIEILKEKYKKENKIHSVVCARENISKDFLFKKLEEFTNKKLTDGDVSILWIDYTRHFNNWLPLNKNKISIVKKTDLNNRDENLVYFYWEHEGRQNIQQIEKSKSKSYFENQEKGGYIAKVV